MKEFYCGIPGNVPGDLQTRAALQSIGCIHVQSVESDGQGIVQTK